MLRSPLTTNDDARTITAIVPRPDRYEVFAYPLGDPGNAAAFYSVAGGSRVRVNLEASEPHTVLQPVALGVTSAQESVAVTLTPVGAPLPAAVEARPLRDWATEWNVVGPFANPRTLGTELSAAVDSSYGPERDPSLTAVYSTLENRQLRWKRASASPDGQIRLNPHFQPNEWVAAYAQAFLYSPVEGEATLLFGADDAHVLWLNGEKISQRQGRHISRADDLAATVSLRAGWNRLLLKVADLDGGWAFQLRVADPEGVYRWSARPRF